MSKQGLELQHPIPVLHCRPSLVAMFHHCLCMAHLTVFLLKLKIKTKLFISVFKHFFASAGFLYILSIQQTSLMGTLYDNGQDS